MRKVHNGKCITNISKKSMAANKKRNLILIIAIALTSIMLTTLFTVGGSIARALEKSTMYQVGTDTHAGFKFLTKEEYEKLSTDSKINALSYNIIVGDVKNEEVYEDYTEVRYTEELSAKHSFSLPTTGNLPEAVDEIAVCTQVLDDFGVPHRLGEVLHLKLSNGSKNYEGDFRVCGFWEKPAETMVNQIYVSKDFQESFSPVWQDEKDKEISEQINSFAGSVNPEFNFGTAFDLEGQMEKLKERLGFGDEINDGVNWAYATSKVDPTAVILIVFLLILIIASGYLIIYNIFYIAVSADIHYYGLLKTVGTTNRQLKKIVLRQAGILSIIAVPIGLAFGYLLSMVILPLVTDSLFSVPCTIYPNVWIFAASALFSWITVRISCIKPCRVVKKVSPVEAVRYCEYTGDKKHKTKKTKKVTPAGMAWENLKRNRKKTVAVVLSIALSVIMLNVTVSLVASFDKELYLQNYMNSDFMIMDGSLMNAENTEGNFSGVDASDMEYMRKAPGMTEMGAVYMEETWHALSGETLSKVQAHYEKYKEQYTHGVHDDWLESLVYDEKMLPCHIYGADRYPYEKMDILSGKSDWEKFKSGKYAVVSAPEEGEAFYEPGEKIAVTMPDGSTQEYEVMAIGDIAYAMGPQHSHGLDIYITVPAEEYLKHCTDGGAMKLCFDVEEESLQEAEEYVADYCEYQKSQLGYNSRRMYEKDFEDMVNMFLLTGGALSFILMLIGVLNFINLTYTSIHERKAELSVLKAIGMTGKQITKMLTLEGVMRIGLTFVLVLTIGMGISYLIVNAVAGQMVMFRYKFVAWPMLLCIPVFALISAVIPRVIGKRLKSV